MNLPIGKIKRDGVTQSRATIDTATVNDYAEAMTDGVTFPPVVVFYDGTTYWLADGFHRDASAAKIGFREIDVEVHQGGRRDAILQSVGANADHGLRRTNKDKRRAVETMLRDEEWVKWANREIARRCTVSHPFVEKVRQSLTGNVSSDNTERTYKHKHGNETTMKTGNIGGRSADDTDTDADKEPTFWDGDEEETEEGKEIGGEEEIEEEDEDDDGPLIFGTAIDDAVADIRIFVMEVLDDLDSDIEKHSVANEAVKALRSLSIGYNQQPVAR